MTTQERDNPLDEVERIVRAQLAVANDTLLSSTFTRDYWKGQRDALQGVLRDIKKVKEEELKNGSLEMP